MSVGGERPSGQGTVSEQDGPDDGPSVLGAASTLPALKKVRPKRSARRAGHAADRDGATQDGAGAAGGDAGTRGSSGDVYVFEPHSTSLPPLREYLRSLVDRRRFMVEMAKADLRGTRSSTVLGSLWGILDPAFQAAIYFLLFTIIRPEEGGGRSLDFLHVLIGGIFLFQLASSALSEGGNSIRQSKNLMLNSAFPRALLPMSTLYKGILKFLPTVGVYVLAHVILQAPVGWGLLLLPVLFALQIVLMLGLSLLVSTITVYFRDAKNLIAYITRLLFFTTPVIYPLALLPDNLRAILSWNPLFALFASYQKIFNGGAPTVFDIVQVALWATFFLLVGAWFFLRHERNFAIHL